MCCQISTGKGLSLLLGSVVVLAVGFSLWSNPPSESRARQLDQLRLQALKNSEIAINRYYDEHKALPADLKIIDKEHFKEQWRDPETNQPLEYKLLGDKSYQLCASFSRQSDALDRHDYLYKNHAAGHNCFEYSGEAKPNKIDMIP